VTFVPDHSLLLTWCHWHQQIIKDCEQSGNGFGQRDVSDEAFGQFESENGDERSSFVKVHLGQRFHHLYFWHLADLMGVLKNVLNVLSAEVSADTDNIPDNTASTQRSKRRSSSDDERDEGAKKKFREGVQSSLKMIGEGLKEANILSTIVSTRAAVRAEEDKVHNLMMKCLLCTPEEKVVFENIMAHHSSRVATYEEELLVLTAKRDRFGA
jgi:hypothetical protein